MTVLGERSLGAQGPAASAVGLGCVDMTGTYGRADEPESIATIHKAIDPGVNMFDTADIYGPFANEKLLKRVLAGRRDKVILATKFGGAELDDEGAVVGGANGRPEYVRASVERSLRHFSRRSGTCRRRFTALAARLPSCTGVMYPGAP